MTRVPMGNAHRFDKDGEANREVVLLALGKGPRTGADLRDALAVKCGDKRAVGRALERLQIRGLVILRDDAWHLTLAGITEAMRLLTARQEARAGA